MLQSVIVDQWLSKFRWFQTGGGRNKKLKLNRLKLFAELQFLTWLNTLVDDESYCCLRAGQRNLSNSLYINIIAQYFFISMADLYFCHIKTLKSLRLLKNLIYRCWIRNIFSDFQNTTNNHSILNIIFFLKTLSTLRHRLVRLKVFILKEEGRGCCGDRLSVSLDDSCSHVNEKKGRYAKEPLFSAKILVCRELE